MNMHDLALPGIRFATRKGSQVELARDILESKVHLGRLKVGIGTPLSPIFVAAFLNQRMLLRMHSVSCAKAHLAFPKSRPRL
jgi:hypothetical protein